MKTTLYKKDLPELTKDMTQGNLNGYTLVRGEGIAESFEGTEIKDFTNWIDATVYIKELFADYASEFPELFAETDWYNVKNIKLFPMINKRATDNKISYAGYQGSNGYRYGTGYKLVLWLPVRVAGEFAYASSDSEDKEADFCYSYEDIARLSVSFRTNKSSIHPVTESKRLKPISQTYSINGFKFIIGDEGISILGKREDKLWFKNSKKSEVKSFRLALDQFCDEMGI